MKSIVYMLSGGQIRGAHTFDDRRRQGQGRFENGVLINQEGLAARSTEHTGIDMCNLGVACIRKECHGDFLALFQKAFQFLLWASWPFDIKLY